MGIDDIIDQLRTAADRPDFGPDDAVATLASALASGTDWLDARYRRMPDGEDSALYPLHRDPGGRFSVIAAVFRPGFPATVHDHGTWAVIGVLSGVERETWFERDGDGPLFERRRFESAGGSVRLVPDGAIHTVEALGDADAVSVHVYGADILSQERSAFDPATGDERPYEPTPTEVVGD
jgi:3-mercaptopropionate dioxygenase